MTQREYKSGGRTAGTETLREKAEKKKKKKRAGRGCDGDEEAGIWGRLTGLSEATEE